MTPEEKPKFDIEKMVDLKESRAGANEEITFDNKGNMIRRNRKFTRNTKRLWRAVTEEKGSIHFYTKKSCLGKHKTNRKAKKAERQNRKKGRK